MALEFLLIGIIFVILSFILFIRPSIFVSLHLWQEKILGFQSQATDRAYKMYRFLGVFFLLCGLFMISVFAFETYSESNPIEIENVSRVTPTTTPEPTPIRFESYEKVELDVKYQYNVFLIGDSMTHALGPRGGRFAEIMSTSYPDNFFEVFNYSVANQNVEIMVERLDEPLDTGDVVFPPILTGSPDLIIIESFGYNPLSQLGLEAGAARQEQKLDELMTIFLREFPDTAVMFLATIAPDRATYGESVLQSSGGEIQAAADERIAYINNHIDYAREHNIPLINVFEESLDATGDGDTKYVNPDDDIHPSVDGLELIAQTMVARIEEENIFPIYTEAE